MQTLLKRRKINQHLSSNLSLAPADSHWFRPALTPTIVPWWPPHSDLSATTRARFSGAGAAQGRYIAALSAAPPCPCPPVSFYRRWWTPDRRLDLHPLRRPGCGREFTEKRGLDRVLCERTTIFCILLLVCNESIQDPFRSEYGDSRIGTVFLDSS